jgi:23S rRNA pseudouridine2604 synthase
MTEYLGYDVTGLNVSASLIFLDIPMGRYRDLTDAEIKELNALIEPSSKTEEASFQKRKCQEEEQSSSKGMIRDLRKKGIINWLKQTMLAPQFKMSLSR